MFTFGNRTKKIGTQVALSLMLVLQLCSRLSAQTPQPTRFLAKEDILIYGLSLKADPPQQTVPKNIATIVSTYLQTPQLPPNVPPFAPDAVVMATLRGPSLPQPMELQTKPNTPFNIPPFSVAGTHSLDNIRLVSNGQILLRSTPESVTINVIDKLLVTQVTSRPLTAQEIRDAGIVFNGANFQAYNFTAAFAIQGTPVNVNFNVVLPSLQSPTAPSNSQVDVPTVPSALTLPSITTLIPDTLKLQTQIPNLSVIGFTLDIPQLKGQDLIVPPIPGVIVIPGNIGFLDQFFSVMLMVSNAAPTGSNLVVTDLTASIVLPPGQDGVVGTPDDPLAMALLPTGPSPQTQPVLQVGPDGKRDVNHIGPQESGSAEYLVEGKREGSFTVEMQITGTLNGLPVGPVTVNGRAAGSVLVRNPKFTLTFTHPSVVNAGEAYTLDITVTNTSQSPANFVSVGLHSQNISGATLVGDASKSIDSIPPGDSQMVSFNLVSKVTGSVTAATLDSDANVAGRFELSTAVGELGIPLSPDSLVLPQEANALPANLRNATVSLLGKEYSVATAPPAALPPNIQRISKQIVIDSAIAAAEAGLRITLHEPIPDSALQLLMDFDGSDYARLPALKPDPSDLAFAQNDRVGFDALRRESVRGDGFAQAVAETLADSINSLGVAALHQHFAEAVSYRPPHISVMVGGASQLPFNLVFLDSAGEQVGGVDANDKFQKQIPFSDFLAFSNAEMALITTPTPGDFVIQLSPISGVAATPVAISIVLPAADGSLRHIVFDNVTIASSPTLQFAATDPYRFTVKIVGSDPASAVPLASSQDAAIVEPPPSTEGAVQMLSADVIKCDPTAPGPGIPVGRVVAVLFNKEVTPGSAQDKAKPQDITNYTADTNAVVGVALQPGNRIAYLAMRDPVGPFVVTQLTVSGISDVHGHAMPTQTIPVQTTIDGGGVVSGKVLAADGTAIANANVRLFYIACDALNGISSKSADANGQYSWGFVSNSFPVQISAIDPGTSQFRNANFTLQRDGQHLTVDIVLLGRGTLQGRTLAEDGTPLKDSAIRVTSMTDQSQYSATSDVDGKFTVGRIPVGNILIEAVNVNAKASTFISQAIPTAGATIVADLTLLTADSPKITLKTGSISGFTLASDGITPVKNVPVIAWYQSGSQSGIPCPGNPPPAECAVAAVNSDSTGAYAMNSVPAGTIRLQTFDQRSLQQGEARVILAANGTIQANILLSGGIGKVSGTVLDPNGKPVASARVGGGMSLTVTDPNGQFVLNDVPVGRRDIVAVSDALGTSGTVTVDLLEDGEQIGATIVLQSVANVAGTVYLSDGKTGVPNVTVYLFQFDGDKIDIVGSAVTDAGGKYSITKIAVGDYVASAFLADFSDGNVRPIPLKFFNQTFKGDIVFRGGGGKVTGHALDSDGHTPLKAAIGISGDQVKIAGGQVAIGFQHVQNYKIVYSDLTTGSYGFSGVWVGDFTLTAAGQFSPDPVSLKGTMPAANVTVQLDIRLQATSSLDGTVFQSDGATPVGANVAVKFKSDEVRVVCSENDSGDEQCVTIPQGIQEENVVTDAQGHFIVPLINAGAYTITAFDPNTGKVGISHGTVRPGEQGHTTVRLLGIGSVTVNVKSSNGVPIPNAKVVLQQTDFPNKQATVITDANGTTVFSGGDALTEGAFAVSATDQTTGFRGRASGKISKDGDQVTVTVFLFDAWGTVTGHVFRPGGLTPVPNADVVVSNLAGPLALTVTDDSGMYSVDHIPVDVRPVMIDVFEAATARVGSSSGVVQFDQQVVNVDVVEIALGLVKGTLLDSSTLTPLQGWEVDLSQTLPSGRAMMPLRTSTSADGSYSFPGASQGQLSLFAFREGVNGTASAQAVLTSEGQIIDVPLLAVIAKPLAGSIIGTVFNADGTVAASAQVDYCPGGDCTFAVTVTAGADGIFSFSNLPLGRFVIRARSQTTHDAGSAVGELSFNGQTAGITVALTGLTKITGTVVNADSSPAAGARLELTGIPTSGCVNPGSKPPDGCVQFALADGTFTFVDVPASSFTIVATGAVSDARGVVGDKLNPGETKVEKIQLAPFGQITGRVLFPDNTPAANIVADLVTQQGHLFVQTANDGTFSFTATPLGSYTLTFQDPLGPGIAMVTGTITGPTQLNDVVLDVAPPMVVSVSPAPSATGVAPTAAVQVAFSKSIDPATAISGNVTLSDGVNVINGTLQTTTGDTVIVFTPLGPLANAARYTIRVANIQDRLGKVLPAPYTSSFITLDTTPPKPVSIDPAPGSTGVPISSVIRIQYSKMIDPTRFQGQPIVLSGSQGQVAGRTDYLFSNTVIVFTPNLPLQENASYQIARLAATDLSGNVEAAPGSYTFQTTNNTPPVLKALSGPPSVIENTQATITADVGGATNIALVDFYINGVFSFSAHSVPFAMTFQAIPNFGKPGSAIQISALASDTSGNRSVSPVTTSILVTADAPPAVTLAISTPTGQNTAANNDRVVVTVHGTDDVGVAQLGYKANTGNALDAAINSASPPVKDYVATFAFHIPANAAPGSTIRVEASASDTKGQITQATPIDIVVLDSIPPVVTITGTTTGSKLNPGQQTTVGVSAQDSGSVASITLKATGFIQLTQTRTVDPPQTSAITSFTFVVPPNATSTDSVTLVATATDRAGNIGTSATVVLGVGDSTPPTIQLQTKNGLTGIAAGQAVSVTATANDDVAVARIDLSGSAAFTVSRSQSFAPALASATADFSFVVPATVSEGATLTLQATATDLAGNVSAPALLTLVVHQVANVTLPGSAVVKAGDTTDQTVQIVGGATGSVTVDLLSDTPDVATVTPSVSFAAGDVSKPFKINAVSGGTAQITASILGVPRTTMTVSVVGGVISGLITDDQLQPVVGAEVTVDSGGVNQSAVSGADGSYSLSGVTGPFVTVKATDPQTHLYGYTTGAMNMKNGYAHINVILMTAASIDGSVFESDGATSAGAGVRVDIYQANDLSAPRATVFTDDKGHYEFPFVQLGEYLLNATGQDGQRAQATVRLDTSAQNVTQPLVYLGQGSISGRVLDGFGNVVNTGAVTLHATSLFGPAPDVKVTTGNFNFTNVLVGQFWIEAHDPMTGLAGSVSGSINKNGDAITGADIHLAAFANLRGTVFTAGRTATVSGATVFASGHTATTNTSGEYELDILPLGNVTVSVDDPGSRGKGLRSTTLTQTGTLQTLDIELFAQGSLAVTVLDAKGSPVPNASVYWQSSNGFVTDGAFARAGADGVAVIDHVLAGTVTVSANNGVLRGSLAAQQLAANQVLQLTIHLQATGSITGLVLDADNQTPVSGGQVTFEGGPNLSGSAPIGQDGTYHIDLLPLSPAGYILKVFDTAGRERAFTKTPIPLLGIDQVATANFTFVGLGHVTGKVFYQATGQSAGGFTVNVQSHNPDFAKVQSGTTDGGGFYHIDDVPVGPFTVSSGALNQHLYGEASGTLVKDGDTASVDVPLSSNAITLPATLHDANNFAWDVQPDGTVAQGSTPFNGGFGLDLAVNGTTSHFAGGEIPTSELSGRQIVTRQNGIAGLDVTRKVFVPSTGYFARFIEILRNPTTAPIIVDANLTSGLKSEMNVVATSREHATVMVGDPTTADQWLTLDDATDGDPALVNGQPATTFIFDGQSGSMHASTGSLATGSSAQLRLGWAQITIPAGGSVAIMHFAAQQTGRAAANASAERLDQLPPEALEGLSSDEIAAIVNFAVPANGLSAIAQLPPLTGEVSGRVFETDSSTLVPGARVTLKSSNTFYGRTFTLTAGSGTFDFVSSFQDGQAQPIPLDAFVLQATHPTTGVKTPALTGAFDTQASLATRDIVFSNTAILGGNVLRHTGAPVTTGGTVLVGSSTTIQPRQYSTSINGDASYRITGLPADSYNLTAVAPHPQGSALLGVAMVTLKSGDIAKQDITIQPTGAVLGTVVTASKAPAANIAVKLTDGAQFSRATTTDTGGAFLLSDIPEGTYTVSAVNPVLNQPVSTTVTVVRDATSPVSLQLQASGKLDVQVNFARGGGAPHSALQLQQQAIGPNFLAIGSTDAAGHFTYNALELGNFVVNASHPDNSRIVASGSGSLNADGNDVSVLITLPPAGIVTGRVTDQNGAAVANVSVTVLSSNTSFGGQQSATTDANGAYTIPGVPQGSFTATVQDLGRQLFGQTAGTIQTDGLPVTANIVITNNVVQLPVYRYDGNRSQYGIDTDGRISYSLGSIFGNYYVNTDGAARLEVISNGTATEFGGSSPAIQEQNGREIVIHQAGIAGLDVTRKIFIPPYGYFARYIELFTNPGTTPISVDLRVDTLMRPFTFSYGLAATSSGDNILDITNPQNPDRWVTYDDGSTTNDPFVNGTKPPTAFVFDGDGAPLRASSASSTGTGASQLNLTFDWNVSVPAGHTVGVMHYVVQETSHAGAIAAAQRLSQIPPEALDGISGDEIAAIQNFAIPTNGISSVAPLRINGFISGTALAGDDATAIPSVSVTFKSSEPLFGRTWTLTPSDKKGQFGVKGTFDDLGSSLPVPVAPFTLQATHPQTNLQVTENGDFTGTFSGNIAVGIGQATASSYAQVQGYVAQNAIDGDPNTPWESAESLTQGTGSPWLEVAFPVDVTISEINLISTYLQRARLDLYDAAGNLVATLDEINTSSGSTDIPVTAAGVRRIRLTDEGDLYQILIYEMQVTGTAAASAGAAHQDIVFTDTGLANVIVHHYDGSPVNSGSLQLIGPVNVNSVQLSNAGTYTYTGLPGGEYRVNASVYEGGYLTGTVGMKVVNGTTTQVAVTLQPTGTIAGTVRHPNGNLSTGSAVRLFNTDNSVSRSTTTDGNGQFVFNDVPPGTFTVEGIEASTGVPSDVTTTLPGPGQIVKQDVTLIAVGQVQVHVNLSNGSPAAGSFVRINPASSSASSPGGNTDSQGNTQLFAVPQGNFTVIAHHPANFTDITVQATGQIVNDGNYPLITITLPGVGSIHGTVTDPTGAAFPNPDVRVVYPDGSEHNSLVSSDSSGHYLSSVVPAGMDLKARAFWPYPNNWAYGERAFKLLQDGDSQVVDLRLPGFAKLQVHVTHADGTPFYQAAVYTKDDYRPYFQFHGYTDSGGNLTIADGQFAEGGFTVHALDASTGFPIGDYSGSVGFGDINTTIAVTVTESVITGNVVGHVYAIDGTTPISGSRLELIGVDDNPFQSERRFSAADGSFSYSGVRYTTRGFDLQAFSPWNNSIFVDYKGALASNGDTQTVNLALPLTPAVAVAPLNPTLPVGCTQQFTAQQTFTDPVGKVNTAAPSSTPAWSSSVPSTATISNTGMATILSPGATTIAAAVGALSGSSQLTATNLGGCMDAARAAQTANLLNLGKVLLAGGYQASVVSGSASAALYDPHSETFSNTGNMTTARTQHTATLLRNGKVLIAGGAAYNGGTGIVSAELYDPSVGTFTATGSMAAARKKHTATLLNDGKVLIVGGGSTNAELYDPATGAFTTTGKLITLRYSHTATLMNDGRVLIAGGVEDDLPGNAVTLQSAEIYDPASGAFSATGLLTTPRFSHSATLLNNGTVLIAGGYPSVFSSEFHDGLASAEIYDPATGNFVPTLGGLLPLDSGTATGLTNGQVLFAGGSPANQFGPNGAFTSTELFDPISGTFALSSNLDSGHSLESATLLPDGTVLIVGGIDTNGELINEFEIYQPPSLAPAGLVSISITPASPTLAVGGTQQFIATGKFADGSTQQLASVIWSVSDTTVVQVSNDATNRGVVFALTAGTITLTASAGSVSSSITLSIVARSAQVLQPSAKQMSALIGDNDDAESGPLNPQPAQNDGASPFQVDSGLQENTGDVFWKTWSLVSRLPGFFQ